MDSTPLKVLVLTTSYPLTEGSYSGIFVKRLVDHLPEGVHATVLTPDCPQEIQTVRNGRATVSRFRYAPHSLQVLAHRPGGIPVALRANRLNYLLLPPFLLSMFINTCVLLGRHDLIHGNWSVNGMIGGIAAKLFNKPVLVTLRGEDISRAKTSYLYRRLLEFCLRHTDRVVCVSEDMLTAITRDFPEYGDKLSVITNGVDKTLLTATRAYADRQSLTFISVGSLIHRKGYDITINALARLSGKISFRFLCAGDGKERLPLQALARESGLQDRIIFTGALSPDEVYRELGGADLFILSSRSEGRPNVLVEAMASGLPVVASDIDGVRELIDNGANGFLFASENSGELAGIIETLATNRALREKTGKNARESIRQKDLTWNNAAAAYTRIYHQITGGRPG